MNTEEIKEFGKKIRQKRQSQGITQQELSVRLGVGLSTICNLEYGCIKSVGVKLKTKIERYLNKNDINNNENEDWGKWVQKTRQETNISQQQLADAIGVSRQTIIYIEQGKNQNINTETKRKIGSFFFRAEKEIAVIERIIEIVSDENFETKIEGIQKIFGCDRKKAVQMLFNNANK